MNGTYYQNPTFPTIDNLNYSNSMNDNNTPLEDLPMQQSYI